MRWAIQTRASSKMGNREFLVLIALLQYRNRKTGTAWPSAPRLADDLGVSVRTVERALGELRTAGVITAVGKRRALSGQFTVEYTFGHEAPSELSGLSEESGGKAPSELSDPSELSGLSSEAPSELSGLGAEAPSELSGQAPSELSDKPLDTTSRETPSSEWSYEGAWLGLVWRPHRQAMNHAMEHYPGVDYYAVTVSYIEYAMSKHYDMKSGYWLNSVKRQYEHENKKEAGYDAAFDETIRRAAAEAQRVREERDRLLEGTTTT